MNTYNGSGKLGGNQMPFIPLTEEQVAGAVEGAIKGGAEVTATAVQGWFKKRKLKKWVRYVVTTRLNQKFANPRCAFRSIEALATAFDERVPPYKLTRETLNGLYQETVRPNGRPNGRDSWIKENNWVWTEENGRHLAKDGKGLYVLQDGVPPGHI